MNNTLKWWWGYEEPQYITLVCGSTSKNEIDTMVRLYLENQPTMWIYGIK